MSCFHLKVPFSPTLTLFSSSVCVCLSDCFFVSLLRVSFSLCCVFLFVSLIRLSFYLCCVFFVSLLRVSLSFCYEFLCLFVTCFFVSLVRVSLARYRVSVPVCRFVFLRLFYGKDCSCYVLSEFL